MRTYLQPKSSTRGFLVCHTPQMVYMPVNDNAKNDDDSNHNESVVNDDKT